MINKAILIIFIFVAFAACDNEPEFTKVKVENIDKSRAYRNTFLPDELKSRILDGVKSASAAKAAAEHGEKKSEHGEKKEEGHGEEKKEEGHGEKKEEHGEKKAEHGAETPAEQKLSEVSGDGYARMRVNVYLVECKKIVEDLCCRAGGCNDEIEVSKLWICFVMVNVCNRDPSFFQNRKIVFDTSVIRTRAIKRNNKIDVPVIPETFVLAHNTNMWKKGK